MSDRCNECPLIGTELCNKQYGYERLPKHLEKYSEELMHTEFELKFKTTDESKENPFDGHIISGHIGGARIVSCDGKVFGCWKNETMQDFLDFALFCSKQKRRKK